MLQRILKRLGRLASDTRRPPRRSKGKRPAHREEGGRKKTASNPAKATAEAETQATLRMEWQADAAAREADHERFRAEITATLARIDTAFAHVSERLDAQGGEHRQRIATLENVLSEATAPRPTSLEQRAKDVASPMVSVILPTRDRAHIVCDAIESVWAQYFTDWELIVVDDGSRDDTADRVAPHLADPRIRFVKRPAGGASAARNTGIELARGSLIAYLDSDNLWYPDFLSVAVDAFTADPAIDMVYGVLVSNSHQPGGARLFWSPFDRDRLLSHNFIDMNVVVHRKSLVDRYGGFDEKISRQCDWDLILRYTEHAPATALPVLAARYRVCDDLRITDVLPFGPDQLAIRRKWYTVPVRQAPRVLYVIWHYPQLSESYIETEIRCMLRWGVHVEVWCEAPAAAPYLSQVPVHRGPLADAVRLAQPDLIHVHWLSYAVAHESSLAALGLPVTIRLHGFEVTTEGIHGLLDRPWVSAVYAFPHHLRALSRTDRRLRGIPSAFDSTLFRPQAVKDRRLVVRTSAALPSKDLPFFFALARRLPEHRFVLAAATCTNVEQYAEELRKIRSDMNSPAELIFDVQRDDLAPLLGNAAIYVHTAKPPGTEHATPIGMPISIAEAMATGAHVLVRDLPEFADYVGEAGTTYRDIDHAAEIIREITAKPEPAWRQAWIASVDRAFEIHADELALRPIFEEWCSVVAAKSGVLRPVD